MRDNQKKSIIEHIKNHGSITSLEAMQQYNIMRLASRISDLKKDGFLIKTEMITKKKPDGKTVRFTRYSLISEDDVK